MVGHKQKHGVEEGDLVRFKETGIFALVREVCDKGRWVQLYVGCGALDHTGPGGEFTGMSMAMISRTAEVVSSESW